MNHTNDPSSPLMLTPPQKTRIYVNLFKNFVCFFFFFFFYFAELPDQCWSAHAYGHLIINNLFISARTSAGAFFFFFFFFGGRALTLHPHIRKNTSDVLLCFSWGGCYYVFLSFELRDTAFVRKVKYENIIRIFLT